MSQLSRSRTPATPPWYRREAWLVVALLACLPVLLASVVPAAWKTPLVGLSGVLVTAAFVMTIRRDRAVRAEEQGEPERSMEDLGSRAT